VDVRSEIGVGRGWVHPPSPNKAVAQASGMISVEAHCSMNHAVVLMVTRAQETNRTLEQIAAAVVDREIRFGA
jgi:hypothetical protein